MSSTKDQKILWARAAGLCARPECRVKLTLGKSAKDEVYTLGEMYHIVGKNNSELCRHHHRVIDGDKRIGRLRDYI